MKKYVYLQLLLLGKMKVLWLNDYLGGDIILTCIHTYIHTYIHTFIGYIPLVIRRKDGQISNTQSVVDYKSCS